MIFPSNYKPMKAKYLDKDTFDLKSGSWAITPKIDGIHATLFIDPQDNVPKFYSLSGKHLPNKQLQRQAQIIAKDHPQYLGAEFEVSVMDGAGETYDYNQIQSMVMSEDKELPYWTKFSLYYLYHYGFADTDFRTVTQGFLPVSSVLYAIHPFLYELLVLIDYRELKQISELFRITGGEGYMLLNLDSAYQHKRSGNLLKFKFKDITDCKITGWEPLVRKDGTVDYSRCGALIVEPKSGPSKGVTTKVGTGMTDEQRQELSQMIQRFGTGGRFVEVEHMPTPKGKALRQPVFLKFRTEGV
jgi:ATP-dependent DNA ligase